MACPSLTLSTLFVSPKLITQHVLFGLFSAVKGPHCCRCKSELQTSFFFSTVWGRMPQDSPGRAWRSSGTVSQWPLRLKDPGLSHTASSTELTQGGPLFCWLGFVTSQEPSLSAKRQDRSLLLEITTNPSALTGTCSEMGQGRWFALGPLVGGAGGGLLLSHHPTASRDTCEPFSPPSYPTTICPVHRNLTFAEVSLTLLVVKESHTITFPS